ncbi:MAG TPA: transcriptional regulator [Chthonomonadaceae bacterium]|nr:transcriptional regulator [Chthonomonadaceae bacterium]
MNVKNPDRLSKADRLNYIVNRMRADQDITPPALAEELHVSERTIYRDLRTLEKKQSFKKRYSRREGRYVFENELTLPPLSLTPSEALALYTAASNPALASDNFFSTDLRSGLAKITASLAPEAAKEVGALENRVAVGPLTLTTENIQRPNMERIKRAMRSNRKLRIRYWSASSDSERTLVVSPYDLRFMRRNWYLLANSEEHGGVRTFKLSRIRAVEILPDRFRYPRHFSADEYFSRAWEMFGGTDEEITIRVRFAPQVAALVVDSRGRQFAAMETEPDGSLVCTAVVNSVKEISWWILSYGSAAEVLSPPELRAAFAQTAREMAALYANP